MVDSPAPPAASTFHDCPSCGYDLSATPLDGDQRTCPECGATSTAVDADAQRRRRARWRTTRRAAALLVATYAPYTWVVAVPFPSTSYDWMWFCLWPLLPAFVVIVLSRQTHDGIRFTLAGMVMLCGFGLAWRLRRMRRAAFIAVLVILAALNGINSVLCHALKAA